MNVKAVSDKTGGIHIGYLPFTKDPAGKNNYGRKITIDTRKVDIDYYEPQKGKAQIKQLFATGGIVFYEQDRYEFAGEKLSYDARDDFMVVTGSKEMPCMLNGVFAEGIEYNLKTGSASAVMSGGVGIIPVRE
jgi:lipopolysaccharide export system protein LptA